MRSAAMTRASRINTRNGLLFAAPFIIGFLAFVLYPVLASLYYSFTKFNAFQAPQWIGTANFTALFKDDLFFTSLLNTLYMTFIGSPLYIAVGLLLALMLTAKIRGQQVLRTIFYIPYILPLVATSLLWIWILNPERGLLNGALALLSIKGPDWLGSPLLTKPSLLMIGAWRAGPIVVVFIAALQDVPRSLYEAAMIDGAGPVRRFFRVTLPMISPAMLFQVVMQIIVNIQYFTEAYLLNASGSRLNDAIGGPGNSVLFYSIYLYHNAFTYMKMGKSAAMAWIMFMIVALLTWLVFRSSRRWVFYGEE
jgi:multiple sugar transport system permease protein